MEMGNEHAHLRWTARQWGLRGTDCRLVVPVAESDSREVLTLYPAFRWLWQWGSEHALDVLEVASFLAELQRRVQDPQKLMQRYVHVVSSVVAYFAVMKGHSNNVRLNRLLRRAMAVQISSRTVPLMAWSFGKWKGSSAEPTAAPSSGSSGAQQ